MNVNIRMAKQALLFSPSQVSLYENLNVRFRQHLKQKLHLISRELSKDNKELYTASVIKLKSAGGIDAVPGLLNAPEFVAKVLEHPFVSARQLFIFLMQATDAGLAQKSSEFDHDRYPYLWTANGDYFIRFDKESGEYSDYKAFKLDGKITLDFFSPNCIRIDAKELGEDASSAIEEYDYEEACDLSEKLEETLSPLSGFSSSVASLISNFTRTVILKKQVKKDNMMFSSASLFP